MVTANPHGDWEAYCEGMQQEADETLARSGHREHAGDGPIAEGWQLTVGSGHSGFGIYAHMEEYPEEGAIFWRSLNDVQIDAYAEGRKDEADETKDAAAELRKAMGISQDFSDWPLSTLMAKAAERIRIQAAPLWQPIETAPEDKYILVATEGGNVGVCVRADHGEGLTWVLDGGWGIGIPYPPGSFRPVLWMPLPKHPEEA
jgi:hypothetical protein